MNTLPRTMTRNYLMAFAFVAGSFFLLRKLRTLRLSRKMRRNVTKGLSQDLNTIPDQVGHYDMDGVSFDREGVVVGSDQTTSKKSSHLPNKNIESDYAPI